MDLSSVQVKQIVQVIENLPWADTGPAIEDLEHVLLLALTAACPYADEWDEEEECRPWDEFSVPETVVETMSEDARLKYVGRLIRSLALLYGIGFGDARSVLVAHDASPAALLRMLNDIVFLPVQAARRPDEPDGAA